MKLTFFSFTETEIFTEDLLSMTDDETLYAIQNALLETPTLGNVIKGTSGARKGRVGNPKRKTGKRGGFRFIYLYLEKAGKIYLLYIYSKKEKSDLSPKQAKDLGELVKAIKKKHGE